MDDLMAGAVQIAQAQQFSMQFDYFLNFFQTLASYDDIQNIESYTNIIENLVIILGGVMGITFFRHLRNKQENAIFSYLTQLQVRIKTLYEIFEQYHTPIMERFVPQTSRRTDITGQTTFIDEIIQNFVSTAQETLDFLEKTDDQMPASKNWPELFNCLIEFLLDVKCLSMDTFHKWSQSNCEQLKKDYYDKHKANLEAILNAIDKNQNKIVKRIFR